LTPSKNQTTVLHIH